MYKHYQSARVSTVLVMLFASWMCFAATHLYSNTAYAQLCATSDLSVATYPTWAAMSDVVDGQRTSVVLFRQIGGTELSCSGTLIHNDPTDPVFPGSYVVTAHHCESARGTPTAWEAVFGHYSNNFSAFLGTSQTLQYVESGNYQTGYDYAIFRVATAPIGATVSDVRAYIPSLGSPSMAVNHAQRPGAAASDPRPMSAAYGELQRVSLSYTWNELFPAWGARPIARTGSNQRAGSSGGGNFDASGRLWGTTFAFADGYEIPVSERVCSYGNGISPLASIAHVSPFIRRLSLPIHLLAKPSSTSNSRIRASCSSSTGPGSSCLLTSSSSAGFSTMQNTGCSLACNPGETVNVRCEVLGSSQATRVVDSIDYSFTNVNVVGGSWTMTSLQESSCGAGSYDCSRSISLDALSTLPGSAPPRPLMVWCDFDED